MYVWYVALIERYREKCKRQKRHSPYADWVLGNVDVVRRVVGHKGLLDVRRAEGIIMDGNGRYTENIGTLFKIMSIVKYYFKWSW